MILIIIQASIIVRNQRRHPQECPPPNSELLDNVGIRVMRNGLCAGFHISLGEANPNTASFLQSIASNCHPNLSFLDHKQPCGAPV